MIATATVRKLGRSAAVVDVEVMSGGKLVALGRVALATGAGN
jgi:acyl-coenzyme A thioesterase PaaI-like protein